MAKKFSARDHQLADRDYQTAATTNQTQKKAGLPRFHFKFDINGLGKPGGVYKVAGVDTEGDGSITGSLAAHEASQLAGPREYRAAGECADCGKRVRRSTTEGIVHINEGPTAAGDHPARLLGALEARQRNTEELNKSLGRQWAPNDFDDDGILKPVRDQ